MKQTTSLMGMPITVEIVDPEVSEDALHKVFLYFQHIDETFSVYKETSEISQINSDRMLLKDASEEMRSVFALSEETKKETKGFFDIRTPHGHFDPSGIVKGWAILNAAKLLDAHGFHHFYVEAGGDIQVRGRNARGNPWTAGIRNPFKKEEIVKIVTLEDCGIATSGTYIRGQHIYNPFRGRKPITDIVSLTVIGKDVYEADRFATAAFAMGRDGIRFLEQRPDLAGYMIDSAGVATMTSTFSAFTPAPCSR
jgi:thiamine biosynthesis lipoprotein